MNCVIASSTAEHANADNQAYIAAEINEEALTFLFKFGVGEFSNTSLELLEVIQKSMTEDKERFLELVVEVDLAKNSDKERYLKLRDEQIEFYAQIALEMNEQAA